MIEPMPSDAKLPLVAQDIACIVVYSIRVEIDEDLESAGRLFC